VHAAITACRAAFASTAVFSFITNFLMLAGPLFMLQIYDRVLSSNSVSTLVALTVLLAMLYGFMGLLDHIRQRIIGRIGRVVDERLRGRVFDAVMTHSLRRSRGVAGQPVSDLVTLRQFISGPAPLSILDMPFTPIYLAVIFCLHWLLGLTAIIAAFAGLVLALINEFVTRRPLAASNKAAQLGTVFTEECRRNSEAAHAMGMLGALRGSWLRVQQRALDENTRGSDRGGLVSTLSKVERLFVQSAILAVGAWLAIEQQITPGAMIAASILLSRALAPVELAVAQWQSFLAFRRAFGRLNAVLKEVPAAPERMALPAPKARLEVENLAAFVPGQEKPLIRGITFRMGPGEALGIIGPMGAGKSTLGRALVGAWPYRHGQIRLDGATFDQRGADPTGRHIGYVPQDLQLFDTSVAENIARFSGEDTAEAVVAAAKLAEAHDLIQRLPEGYNSRIGENGANLSAGQKQRIALARALFGDPVLVVMDEPNANLDRDGDIALDRAIRAMKQRGAAVIIIAHRPSALAAVDRILVLRDGQMVDLGEREEVLGKFALRAVPPAPRTPLVAVNKD
jgi:ATP-binding cassette subfamily C protein